MNNLREIKDRLEQVERELAEGAWDYVTLKHAYNKLHRENEVLKNETGPNFTYSDILSRVRMCLDQTADLQLNFASKSTRNLWAEKITESIYATID